MPEYFLHDDIYIEDGEPAAEFERLVTASSKPGGLFDTLFQSFKWKLKLALKSTKPLQYLTRKERGSEICCRETRLEKDDGLFRRYLHVWDVPDPPDAAGLMQQLADSSEYSAINALVFEEIQNLVLNVQPAANDSFELNDDFLVIRKQLSSATLGTHLFNADLLLPVMESKQWRNFGRFQSITGYLNSVIEIWHLPKAHIGLSLNHLKASLELPPQSALAGVFRDFEESSRAEWQDSMQAYIAP
jgi:hypothetical protein